MPDKYFSKIIKVIKTKESLRTVTATRSIRRQHVNIYYGILWSLGTEKEH